MFGHVAVGSSDAGDADDVKVEGQEPVKPNGVRWDP